MSLDDGDVVVVVVVDKEAGLVVDPLYGGDGTPLHGSTVFYWLYKCGGGIDRVLLWGWLWLVGW